MTGKQELLEQIRLMNELADANICRMSDGALRMLAQGLHTLMGKQFTTRFSKEDVARFYNKSYRTIERWQSVYDDFPKPRHHGTKEVSYDCEEVVNWKKSHKRLFVEP